MPSPYMRSGTSAKDQFEDVMVDERGPGNGRGTTRWSGSHDAA